VFSYAYKITKYSNKIVAKQDKKFSQITTITPAGTVVVFAVFDER
jgi:hypothetical protein